MHALSAASAPWTIISEPDGPKQPTRVCEMPDCPMPYRGLIRAMRPRVHIDQTTGKKLRDRQIPPQGEPLNLSWLEQSHPAADSCSKVCRMRSATSEGWVLLCWQTSIGCLLEVRASI